MVAILCDTPQVKLKISAFVLCFFYMHLIANKKYTFAYKNLISFLLYFFGAAAARE